MLRSKRHAPENDRHFTLCWFVLVLVTLYAPAAWTQPDSLRVMPLGDSITEAQGGFAGYRYWLWHALEDANHPVDFVGSQYGVWNGDPPYTDYDQDHEGHWGWRADQILASIGPWAAACLPDVVLVHLGHNDLWQGQTISSTIDELGQIIDMIRGVKPDATFLLAQVIPSIPAALDSIPYLNDRIAILGALKDTEESPVLVVDQHTGFDPWIHTYDSVHPNEAGEQLMAERWFAPLDSIFTHLTDVAPLSAVTGNGFQLASAPNPFNPRTTLSFVLPSGSTVTLTVHDFAGRLVDVLVEGETLPAGTHSVTWTGRDSQGRAMPSSTYFYRLEAGGYVETKRMTLIR